MTEGRVLGRSTTATGYNTDTAAHSGRMYQASPLQASPSTMSNPNGGPVPGGALGRPRRGSTAQYNNQSTSVFGKFFKNIKLPFGKNQNIPMAQTQSQSPAHAQHSRAGQSVPVSQSGTRRNGAAGLQSPSAHSKHQAHGMGGDEDNTTRSEATTTAPNTPSSVGFGSQSSMQSQDVRSPLSANAQSPGGFGGADPSPRTNLEAAQASKTQGSQAAHGHTEVDASSAAVVSSVASTTKPASSHVGGGGSAPVASVPSAQSPPSTVAVAAPSRGSVDPMDPVLGGTDLHDTGKPCAQPQTSSPQPLAPTPPVARTPHKPHVTASNIRPSGGGATRVPSRFTWRVARALVTLRMQPAEAFSVNGVPWSDWELTKIPTLGASPTSCRVQEMYKATVPAHPNSPGARPIRLFIKRIPIGVWKQQWEAQNRWNGEFVTDGENFVMEAAALAYLQEHGNGLAPRLLGVLQLKGCGMSRHSRGPRRSAVVSNTSRDSGDDVTHIVIVSELYGEDLLDFLERRDKEKRPLGPEEKRTLQFHALMILNRLHSLGLAHLDFTPENVLIGTHGLKLCDFAKSTPLWSAQLRHVDGSTSSFTLPASPAMGAPQISSASAGKGGSSVHSTPSFVMNHTNGNYTNGQSHMPVYHFESCEPTVGKGAYMPPECWKVYWQLEDTKVQYPLEELYNFKNPDQRVTYYFAVSPADVYMAGVLLFWIWADGGVWKSSDIKQDERYHNLVKSELNFDLFRECRKWPEELKSALKGALRVDPRNRSTLESLLSHKWFNGQPSMIGGPDAVTISSIAASPR